MIRNPLITRLALIACAASGWVATPTWAAERPTVILVHGAFVDGSDWAKVVTRLEAQGVHAVAVQEPLTSLADLAHTLSDKGGALRSRVSDEACEKKGG